MASILDLFRKMKEVDAGISSLKNEIKEVKKQDEQIAAKKGIAMAKIKTENKYGA